MNNEVERYVGELRELRARVKELEVRLNLPETETFFYNVLKEREKNH
jgi:predicted nuclease with TOPRIM domain